MGAGAPTVGEAQTIERGIADHEARRSAAMGGTERKLQNKKAKTALLVGLRGPAMHRAATRKGNVPEQTVPVA